MDGDGVGHLPAKRSQETRGTPRRGSSKLIPSFSTLEEQKIIPIKKSDVTSIGLKIAKTIALGGTHELELGATIFNLPNASGHHQYKYDGANQVWSPHFLEERNRQSPRALQLTFVFRY